MPAHWPLILKSTLWWLTSYLGISLRGGIDEVKQAEALRLAFLGIYTIMLVKSYMYASRSLSHLHVCESHIVTTHIYMSHM